MTTDGRKAGTESAFCGKASPSSARAEEGEENRERKHAGEKRRCLERLTRLKSSEGSRWMGPSELLMLQVSFYTGEQGVGGA